MYSTFDPKALTQSGNPTGIIRQYYVPAPPLSEFVGVFWYWQARNLLAGLEYILPSATVELVINLDSVRVTDSVLGGPCSKPAIISGLFQKDSVNRAIGINFKPGGIYPFLPFPVNEFHNQNISLDHIWGEQGARRLLSQIYNCKTVFGKFKLLEKWLLRNLFRNPEHSPVVTMAMSEIQRNPAVKTINIIENSAISQRRFIQVFQTETGLTPKLYAKICRFQKSLDMIENSVDMNWTDIALSCGYYDQSHFNHDFRKLSGITPTTYLDIRTGHRNHLPIIH